VLAAFAVLRPPTRSSLFAYTTLFRSQQAPRSEVRGHAKSQVRLRAPPHHRAITTEPGSLDVRSREVGECGQERLVVRVHVVVVEGGVGPEDEMQLRRDHIVAQRAAIQE